VITTQHQEESPSVIVFQQHTQDKVKSLKFLWASVTKCGWSHFTKHTHSLSLSLLPPWIIPVFLLSYSTLEKVSKPWAPEKTSHFERGHQRGQNRECPAILQVCVWRWGRIYVCDIGNWGSGGIHGVWGREMDRLCALVREWAECQFVSLPHILQAWHCESDQAALPLNSCVSVCVNGEGCIHVDSWVYISSELPHLNQHFIT